MAGTSEPWWKSAVFYQIYPRSFADSNGDGIGDLRGIINHLDHLKGSPQSLGVDAIWLSPFYPSPQADFGYDVSNYTDIHPDYGTLADFDDLIAQAHQRDIKVIIDWVANHTSDQHAWFTESRSSRTNPKADWYIWRDSAPGGGPPNAWRSFFGPAGKAWTYDSTRDQWYLHSYLSEQPDLNWENPQVRAAMHNVLRFWLDRGVDGFRLDAITGLSKDIQLSGGGKMSEGPAIHQRLREIRAVIDEYQDRVMVGETNVGNPELFKQYLNTGDELHLGHVYYLADKRWKANEVQKAPDLLESIFTNDAWPSWFMGNHDTPRIASRMHHRLRLRPLSNVAERVTLGLGSTRLSDALAGRTGNGRDRARLVAMLLATLRGTPFIYQGDELAMRNTPVSRGQRVDPVGRDPQRTPIPWESPATVGPGAGFTTGKPWLPIGADARRINVAIQRADPHSPLALNRQLLAYRHQTPALQLGTYRPIEGVADGVFVFERALGAERRVVALNYTRRVKVFSTVSLGVNRIDVSTQAFRKTGPIDNGAIRMLPNEGVILA